MKKLKNYCGWAYCLILLAALTGLAGCKKQPFIQTVAQTPYLGLPGGLEQLNSIDLEHLRAREGFMPLMQDLEVRLKAKPVMDVLRNRVGFDPWQQIDQVIMGSRGSSPVNPLLKTVFIVRGDFKNPAATLGKLHAWLSDEVLIAPPPFKQSMQLDTGFKTFQTSGQSQLNEALVFNLNFGFPDDRTMVFSFSPELLTETLLVIGGQAEGIQQDKQWQAMLQRPNVGAVLWGTGNMPAGIDGPAAALPGVAALRGARQYYYDVNLNDDLLVQVGLLSDSIEAATQLTTGVKGGLDLLKAMLTQPAPAPNPAAPPSGLAMMNAVMAQLATTAPETAKLPGKILMMTELQTSKISLKLSAEERQSLMDEWTNLLEKAQPGQPLTPPGAPALPTAPPTGAAPVAPGAAPTK